MQSLYFLNININCRNRMKVISLWSGGKDSCFACYKAVSQGYQVCALFNFIDHIRKRSLSHWLPSELVLEQAKLTGIEILQKAMPKETYEEEFKNLVMDWKKKRDIKGIVFGDIYLQEHKDWIERVCNGLEIKAIMPLWNRDTSNLITEFINKDFEAVVVTTQADLLNKETLGKKIDNEFIKNLSTKIDPCGEKGEFHTLVIAGPLFKGRIEILKSKKLLKGENWLLDILDWRIV